MLPVILIWLHHQWKQLRVIDCHYVTFDLQPSSSNDDVMVEKKGACYVFTK